MRNLTRRLIKPNMFMNIKGWGALRVASSIILLVSFAGGWWFIRGMMSVPTLGAEWQPLEVSGLFTESKEIELGTLAPKDRVERRVRLSNQSPEHWSIEEILPDCGCTTVASGDRNLAPGRIIDLPLIMDASKLGTGRFRKRVLVRLVSGGRRHEALFHLTGQVSSAADASDVVGGASMFSFSSQLIDLGDVEMISAAAGSVSVQNTSGKEISVEVKTECRCTHATLDTKIVPPGGTAVLGVAFRPGGQQIEPGKNVEESVLVTARSGDAVDRKKLVVKAHVTKNVALAPGSVDFGDIPSGTSAARNVVFRFSAPPDSSMSPVTGTGIIHPAVVVSDSGMTSPTELRCEIALPPTMPVGVFADFVKIQAQHSGKTMPFLVPVRGNICEGGIATHPRTLQIRSSEGQWVPLRYQLKSLNGEPFEIIAIESSEFEIRPRFECGSRQAVFDIEADVRLKAKGHGNSSPLKASIATRIRILNESHLVQLPLECFFNNPSH